MHQNAKHNRDIQAAGWVMVWQPGPGEPETPPGSEHHETRASSSERRQPGPGNSNKPPSGGGFRHFREVMLQMEYKPPLWRRVLDGIGSTLQFLIFKPNFAWVLVVLLLYTLVLMSK